MATFMCRPSLDNPYSLFTISNAWRMQMADQQHRIEKRAQEIWEEGLAHDNIGKLAHKYGFAKGEIVSLNWDALPEKIQGELREMANSEQQKH